jgi:predicted nucleic acid-binding protein
MFTRVLTELRKFELFEIGGSELAIQAVRNLRHLRRRGRTVRKTIDCLIAAFCLSMGTPCSIDAHPPVDGLDALDRV